MHKCFKKIKNYFRSKRPIGEDGANDTHIHQKLYPKFNIFPKTYQKLKILEIILLLIV